LAGNTAAGGAGGEANPPVPGGNRRAARFRIARKRGIA
jgi:hypothetical protein